MMAIAMSCLHTVHCSFNTIKSSELNLILATRLDSAKHCGGRGQRLLLEKKRMRKLLILKILMAKRSEEEEPLIKVNDS